VIGNDIVDLALSRKESNWKRKGFLDKIFTAKEQQFITEAENPEIMVWVLWSSKEAVYKIWNRLTQIRAFNPLRIECIEGAFVNTNFYGKVVCESKTYFFETETNNEYIHTIALTNRMDFKKIICLEDRKNVQKKAGIPFFYDDSDFILKPISISHHGQFERIVSI
jgi:4'-phosphopantetheinyl transferase EntD